MYSKDYQLFNMLKAEINNAFAMKQTKNII